MKKSVVLVFFSLITVWAFAQQKDCSTVHVSGTDATYDGMCAENWEVSYDFTLCTVVNGSDGHLERYFAFDNGTATDLSTGETYNIRVHSGANRNPGPGSIAADGGTFHWAGVVAGKIVVQLVTHINYDANGNPNIVRHNNIRCL